MEFRLTYQGQLLASGSDHRQEYARVPEKHRMRRIFHRQLKKLWYTHPTLVPRTQSDAEGVMTMKMGVQGAHEYPSHVERLADNWTENGFRFVPLVTKESGLNCKLEVLILRVGMPGAQMQNSDIDNRIKTLFDALQKPDGKQQLGGETPQDGEDPFFVLLEDDRLITHLSVETDTLLESVSADETDQLTDARVVITCTIWPYVVGPLNLDFM